MLLCFSKPRDSSKRDPCSARTPLQVPKDPMGVKGKTPIAFGGGEVLGSNFDARLSG